MTQRFDREAASLFGIAIAGMISRIGAPPPPDPTPKFMFSCGIQGSPGIRVDVESEATERAKSVVHLEFAPGRVRKGPVTVAVLHMTGDRSAAWKECALWSPVSGPSLLVAKDGSASFEIRGVDLARAAPPPRTTLQSGFVRGRRDLAAAAKLIKALPSDVVLDAERIATVDLPSPEEHRIATASRLAAMSAAHRRRRTAGGMPPGSGAHGSPEGTPGGDPSDEPSFMLDMNDETLLRFLSGRGAGPDNDEEVSVLRLQRGDLIAFMVWLGERRDQWRDWRDFAEASSNRALGGHLGTLRKGSAGEAPTDFDVNIHPDWMGIDLVAEFPSRTAVIARHRFVRAGDAEAFRDRYRETENITRWALFEAACLLKRRELAWLIATILERGSVLNDWDAKHAPTIH